MMKTVKAVIDRLQGEAGYATGGEVNKLVFSGLDVHEMLNEIEQAVYEEEEKLVTAVEALEFASKDFVRVNGVKEETKISKKAKQALAEIGGEDD